MKRLVLWAMPIALMVAIATSTASADTISSRFHMYWSSPTHSMCYRVNDFTLFDFDPYAVAGQTFWFRSNTDSPSYSAAASALIDGNWDYIWVFSYDNLNGSGLLSYQFPGVEGSGRADFIGWHIDGIGITSHGAYESGMQQYTFMVDYTVPEPASVLALLCGVTGMGGLVMKRRRG